ncbi:hypothetical protein [Peribacillus simplex]
MAAPKVSATLALIIDQRHYKKRPSSSIDYLYKNGVKKDIELFSLLGQWTIRRIQRS